MTARRRNSPEIVEQSPEQKRVLIVDDNREAAEMLQMLLEMQGYTAEVANAGPEGLARQARFVPHVICSDLNMPGMSGYEFARQVRAAGPAGRCRPAGNPGSRVRSAPDQTLFPCRHTGAD